MNRRFLRNHDGDPSGNPGPDPQAQGESTQEQQPSFVTADDLREFKNSMFADLRRTIQGMQPKQPAAPQGKQPTKESQPAGVPPVSYESMEDLSDEMDGQNLSKAVRRKIRADFRREQPADVSSWFAEQRSYYVQPAPQATEPTNSEPPMQTPRPVTDVGAPAQAAGLESNDPVWELADSQVNSLVRKHGMVGAGQILRTRLKADMRGKMFRLGRGK